MSRSIRRLALVGADNLLGREIKEVVEAARRDVQIDSFASNGEANFGEEEGEAVYRQAVNADSLRDVDAVVLAGSPEGSSKALAALKALTAAPILIDATGTLDQEPNARIAAPLLEDAAPQGPIVVIAHPAATMLATVLSKLARGPITRAVFEVFEPASEQGRLGIAELQQQTTSLLSFKPLEKKIYDVQVSFAMAPAYGEDAVASLSSIEQRIERHLATLLARSVQSGNAVPMPSLRLIQAPVFHGYTLSGWIELEKSAGLTDIEKWLQSEDIDVRTGEQEFPTNIGVAGQSGLVVGDIRTDRNNPRAIWLWVVADNLRIAADGVRQVIGQLGR